MEGRKLGLEFLGRSFSHLVVDDDHCMFFFVIVFFFPWFILWDLKFLMLSFDPSHVIM